MGAGYRKAGSLVELKPALAQAAVVGYLDPGNLFTCGLPPLARNQVPIWQKKKKDTVLQSIVCASQILLTPQLLVKRNEYL